MGIRLVIAAYSSYAHLPDRPFRLLCYMAAIAKDDDPMPVYFGGRDALATALGADKDPAGYQVVRRAISVLVMYGAVTRVAAGHNGRQSEYALNVKDLGPRRYSRSDPQQDAVGVHPPIPFRPRRESLSE